MVYDRRFVFCPRSDLPFAAPCARAGAQDESVSAPASQHPDPRAPPTARSERNPSDRRARTLHPRCRGAEIPVTRRYPPGPISAAGLLPSIETARCHDGLASTDCLSLSKIIAVSIFSRIAGTVEEVHDGRLGCVFGTLLALLRDDLAVQGSGFRRFDTQTRDPAFYDDPSSRARARIRTAIEAFFLSVLCDRRAAGCISRPARRAYRPAGYPVSDRADCLFLPISADVRRFARSCGTSALRINSRFCCSCPAIRGCLPGYARHCERSEAIHFATQIKSVLLRVAAPRMTTT